MTRWGARGRSILWWLKFLWLNLTFWTIAPLFTFLVLVVAAPSIYLFDLLSRNRRKSKLFLRETIRIYGYCITRISWPFVKVKFVDHAPHEGAPYLLICNHRSASDGFLVSYVAYEAVQVVNVWPTRVPIMGFLARIAGYLRVRQMPFDEFIRAGSALLADGVSIVAFPEGTRSGTTKLGPFHGSSLRLAQQNGVKIIPFAISGTEDKPRRGSAWLNPGLVVLRKLPAVTSEHYAGMSPYKLKMLVREMIRQHLEMPPE